jgi:putative membrane protein
MTIQLGGQAVAVEPHLDVVLLCAGLLLAYVALVRRHGAVLAPGPDRRAVTGRQITYFTLGVFALWIASGSPLHDLADRYLFSAHMIQHLIQAFVIAPLLVLGTPGWMLEVITRQPLVRAAVRSLGQPLVAGVLFNGVLLLIHWPSAVTAMVENSVFHGSMHILLVVSSLLMWLPVLSNSPAVTPRMNPLPRMGYMFAMTLMPTVPASFLTFGDPSAPVYPVYAQFPRLWDLPVGEDMLIAGLLMKIGGGFLLWGIIASMFFRWAAAQERADADVNRGRGGRRTHEPQPNPSA